MVMLKSISFTLAKIEDAEIDFLKSALFSVPTIQDNVRDVRLLPHCGIKLGC